MTQGPWQAAVLCIAVSIPCANLRTPGTSVGPRCEIWEFSLRTVRTPQLTAESSQGLRNSHYCNFQSHFAVWLIQGHTVNTGKTEDRSRCPDPQGQVQTTQPCLSDWVRKVQSSGIMTRFHNLPSQSLEKESDIKNYLKEEKKRTPPSTSDKITCWQKKRYWEIVYTGGSKNYKKGKWKRKCNWKNSLSHTNAILDSWTSDFKDD